MNENLINSQHNTVICWPPLRPPYRINTTSCSFPADDAGSSLSRAARRCLQLVNPFSDSKVINVLRMSYMKVLRPRSSKLGSRICVIIRKYINNGFLSNGSLGMFVKEQTLF